ncbi:hypothetical protein XA68_18372 [Ophiocordyceps unilateralis]|uniref:Uncharacterized protein n=1 Tax=Ophiocordyceps unilateralis TaxID=268505 RepID=A0A2A9P3I4_OPHUN|nr:hypothetical protein XA68_18372 [Ophiocordyceps unilateralis]
MGRWDSPYTSPAACFRDRQPKARTAGEKKCDSPTEDCDETPDQKRTVLPRRAPAAGCQDVKEECVGTEVSCARRQDPELCFAAREKAPWIAAGSHDCLDATEEKCVGTDEWCKTDQAKSIYGSSESCLSFREPGAPSWRQRSLENCQEKDAEDCEATEEYCGRFTGLKERLRCFATRQRPPFSVIYSPGCDEYQTSELCNGTANWCRETTALSLYGSETDCLELRGKVPERRKWQPKAANCSDASESCLGTEKVCNSLVHDHLRDDCFAARERPPFLPATPALCLKEKPADEGCLGTYAWCMHQFRQANYATAKQCFSLRGLDIAEFEKQLEDGLVTSLDTAFATLLINMTLARSSLEAAKPFFIDRLRLVREYRWDLAVFASRKAFGRYIAPDGER